MLAFGRQELPPSFPPARAKQFGSSGTPRKGPVEAHASCAEIISTTTYLSKQLAPGNLSSCAEFFNAWAVDRLEHIIRFFFHGRHFSKIIILYRKCRESMNE
jgi:hypothetical protein